jgi:hypothetical protein
MSKNPPDEPGSPSDRFHPCRVANTTSNVQIPLNRFQSGPTSDLSLAIGNIQGARDGCYHPEGSQAQAYQSPYSQPRNYQHQNYQSPCSSVDGPQVSAATKGDARGSSRPMVKARSKWTREDDTLLIKLRGENMKWEDIAKEFPGRSAISCRLHYQNYLEKGVKWSEDKKDDLARASHQ